MSEKAIVGAVKTVRAVEKGVENVVKKAWSILDALSDQEGPSTYLSDRAVRSIQGKE